ncbi:helix-turn-helix domain-containing protein [Streptomyces sp. NA04227]|uniref:helix-turn-helix transcriptional regulator n=1 Tax=Streptomyces sp. NA04227 TaxID=2742136 RepID=UPI001591BD4D|nr:helix-turn-helix transcriptional regulator [Streptomyces sp. NA04227]QKW10725.1 helix-turn-helix domain-containing protein [Streptomyces sp. NA04227]
MTTAQRRRPELAAFLRSRRARVSPADVGMPPGLRRRTPGLRREEVAQLSGVGVTWYTWLEQGRPINASPQVLNAIARTLRLGHPEREHLYHLAEVPFEAAPQAPVRQVDRELQGILDALDPHPAVIYNSRYDILATNTGYRDLFVVDEQHPALRGEMTPNALWELFTAREADCPVVFRESELPVMVATLRSAYGRHVGEPDWECFLARMAAVSPYFSQLWEKADVVPSGRRVKTFRHRAVGELRMTSVSLSIDGMPECRIVTYTPADAESAARAAQLRALQGEESHSHRDVSPAEVR